MSLGQKPNFEHYTQLRRAIQDWLLGTSSTLQIAHHFNITSQSLDQLLSWNGLCDINGRPEENTTIQDVFNLIFLVYTLENRKTIRERLLRK